MPVKYTREALEKACKQCCNYSDVARHFNVAPQSASYRWIRQRIKDEKLDVSHFISRGYCRASGNLGGSRRKTPDQILIAGCQARVSSHMLRRALLEIGREHKCVKCPLQKEWNGKPLQLEVDHISGDWTDNRRENLRFMCPNCHSQEPTSQNNLKGRKTVLAPLWEAREEVATPKASGAPSPKLPRPVICGEKETLKRMVWEMPMEQIAESYRVHHLVVRRWLRKLEITNLPPVGYWLRRSKGWTHEEALNPIPKRVKKGNRYITDEDIDKAVMLYGAGKTVRAIAKILKVDRDAIRRALTRRGITVVPYGKGKKRNTISIPA